jgi:hypothetical protein
VATVHNTVKVMIRAHLTIVHVFHAYTSMDTPWVAHVVSQYTPVRYDRIASVLVTYEATQFARPQEIPYVPVHNSNLLTGARRSVLNQLKRGLPPWSSEFQIRPLPFLPIQYSPFFTNLPDPVSNYVNHLIILLNHIGPPSIERVLSRANSNHSSSTDSLYN